MEDLRELSCDSQVLTRGRIGVRDYCDTLLSVCQNTLRRDRTFVIAVPKVTLVTADRSAFGGSKMSFLEERVAHRFLTPNGCAIPNWSMPRLLCH